MTEQAIPETSLASTVGHIAAVITNERFPTAYRAALRRLTPGGALPLVFSRFAVQHLPTDWERHRDDWASLLAGMAIMAPTAHNPSRGLGRALAEANYSEHRLERLLSAQGDTRRTLMLRAARFLAAKGMPFNWADAAALLLTLDDDKRERLHQRIARDFFSHQPADKKPATT